MRQSAKTIAIKLLTRRYSPSVFDLMGYGLTPEQQTKILESIEHSVNKIWFNSWIRPGLEEIIEKGK